MKQYKLGIDIGGTKCAVILGKITPRKEIQLIDKLSFPTETHKGYVYTIQNIFRGIKTLLAQNNLQPSDIFSAGISCGGPLDSKTGIIQSPPNLPGWDNVALVTLIEKEFNLQTALQNDANACALAEWKYGAARGYNNVIFFTFGTGMGAGLILNGKLYTGTNDMAGEAGHIRLAQNGPVGYGKAGSFEGFCSGGGIAQLAQNKIVEKIQAGEKTTLCNSIEKLSGISAKTVAEAAFAGDPVAIDIYATCGQYLGKALSIFIDILNPEIIVLGSIYGRAQPLIEPFMQKVIEKETLPHTRQVCKIVPAGLGENIGDYAALSVAP